MELSKKTTILFPPELHDRLTRLAAQRRTSLGSLVREACERQYGRSAPEDRLRAVRALAQLSLPVGSPEEMARESLPSADELLP